MYVELQRLNQELISAKARIYRLEAQVAERDRKLMLVEQEIVLEGEPLEVLRES